MLARALVGASLRRATGAAARCCSSAARALATHPSHAAAARPEHAAPKAASEPSSRLLRAGLATAAALGAWAVAGPEARADAGPRDGLERLALLCGAAFREAGFPTGRRLLLEIKAKARSSGSWERAFFQSLKAQVTADPRLLEGPLGDSDLAPALRPGAKQEPPAPAPWPWLEQAGATGASAPTAKAGRRDGRLSVSEAATAGAVLGGFVGAAVGLPLLIYHDCFGPPGLGTQRFLLTTATGVVAGSALARAAAQQEWERVYLERARARGWAEAGRLRALEGTLRRALAEADRATGTWPWGWLVRLVPVAA
ncbi:hypothetical protein HYH03_010601 [Edaphochlamys debaryana]|uniref:Uncharacterized protein n=1 Tax=Edaphochlamys debaryana TaxID=47281 RepID=A0A835XVX1_9CHLO|nr:hypothetical protein HYH03_010601 [Edaphochlamys debaryana]|eukprot:KAG2491161.1 hypothetical protein HYH03_010601 [Edaphochlamys debaryana]